MSDNYEDFDDEIDEELDEDLTQKDTPVIRELRKDAKQAKKARAEANAKAEEAERLRRELAFVKAGIETDSRLGQMLFKSYDGELTAEAIKSFAAEVGLATPAVEPENPRTAAAAEIADTFASISGNAAPAIVPPADPTVTFLDDFDRAIAKGFRKEDAYAEAAKLMRSRMMNTPSGK